MRHLLILSTAIYEAQNKPETLSQARNVRKLLMSNIARH